MPAAEIIGEALGGVARFAGRVVVELVLGVLIHGAGYLLVRPFKPGIEPDDQLCAVVGLCFWAVAGAGGLLAWRALAA